jgi:hypothetical protein
VLDRLILYERRIENSMLRMLRELKKQQIMKQIIQQGQAIPNPMNDNRDEAATRFGLNDIDLKKQSQFVPGMMGVNPIMEGGYGDMSRFGAGANKAKQSQFDAPFSPEGIPETDNPPTAATG